MGSQSRFVQTSDDLSVPAEAREQMADLLADGDLDGLVNVVNGFAQADAIDAAARLQRVPASLAAAAK